jgi:hypothetical protein
MDRDLHWRAIALIQAAFGRPFDLALMLMKQRL